MSAYTFYDASVPVLKEALEALEAILKKAEQAPNADSLPEARIFDDMLPLTFQVHFVTDITQKFVARATGAEPASLENNLKTFPEFYKRIDFAREILDKADKETINQRVNETVTIGMGPGKTGQLLSRNFLTGYALPNIFFHVSTAYNILRKEGVPLGKMDFLSHFLSKHISQ